MFLAIRHGERGDREYKFSDFQELAKSMKFFWDPPITSLGSKQVSFFSKLLRLDKRRLFSSLMYLANSPLRATRTF